MEQNKSTSGWKAWLKLSRIVPLLTILVAGVAEVLGILNVFQVTLVEGIILALLGLIAIDALTERLGILEKIEIRIGNLESRIELRVSADNLLRPREQIPSFELSLQQGEEILVAGRSLAGLLDDYGTNIQQAAANGKRFRFLVVDPDNPSLMSALSDTGSSYPDALTPEQEIRDAILRFNLIIENSPRGSVEIRIMDHIPPNTYRIVNGRKPNGQMVIEQFGYKISTSERLHMHLARATDGRSFAFYLEQFDRMWRDAKPVSKRSLR